MLICLACENAVFSDVFLDSNSDVLTQWKSLSAALSQRHQLNGMATRRNPLASALSKAFKKRKQKVIKGYSKNSLRRRGTFDLLLSYWLRQHSVDNWEVNISGIIFDMGGTVHTQLYPHPTQPRKKDRTQTFYFSTTLVKKNKQKPWDLTANSME